jgi:predicted dehydrogenase
LQPRTRIAIAGAGYIGQAHLAAAQLSGTVELVALADPAQAAMKIAATVGVPWYATLDELIAKARPDGIVLATPNQFHLPHALQCIRAGLPILLEKPITPTVAEAETLVQAVEQQKAKVLIGHHRAHSPIMACARKVVQSGKLGRLVSVMGSALFLKPDHYYTDAPWRRELGAGPILLNMVHEVHNLRMLCGDIVLVQAIASHAVREFPVEDTVAIILRFANGSLGTFMLSDTAASARSWEQTSQENKAYPSYDDEDCYVISGTFGSLSVPTMRIKSYAKNEDRSWWKPFELSVADMTHDDPIKLQMEHFGAVVRGEAAPLVSARDGLDNLRITQAIVQAAKTGQTVHIAPTSAA